VSLPKAIPQQQQSNASSKEEIPSLTNPKVKALDIQGTVT
jgi:hypothetical protein